ncbi:uncharacterized protein LOC105694457 [Orussus abietinus]|uniref:uncharacterized protein LOC105694457 n=1 Tax=Orussus abietinus TaxID=222816 RepID=UPI0006254B62|nr:uncharacterized protein LOC105694457 [Orussus abietinus]XP_023287545.1 uncharacterized protein LOC105694457 [Orussus abietinus]
MSLVEPLYCNQQINVPPKLPLILKQFCKAAIRTQPYDLLKWSSAYFRALAEGEEPPAKSRLEYPPPCTPSGLTLGFLKVLLRQFGDYNKVLSVDSVLHRWDCLCLDRKELCLIMTIGRFRRKCQVKKFLAVAVGLLSSSLFETMIMLCELFTHEPDGGSAMIPLSLFMELYGYLANLRCDGVPRESLDEDEEILIQRESDRSASSQKTRDFFDDPRVPSAGRETETEPNMEIRMVVKNDTVNGMQGDDQQMKSEVFEKSSGSPVDKFDDASLTSNSMKETSNGFGTDEKSLGQTSSQQEERQPTESEGTETSNNTAVGNLGKFCETDGDSRKTRHVEESAVEKKRMKLEEVGLPKHYPYIPGIGPQLSPEQIAKVEAWMIECAILQEGMVGPRNLRHFQCPSLDRPWTSESQL